MEILEFKLEPDFAELWDICLHNFLYDKDAYVRDILGLFKSIGINRSSRILETCAGTGFISLYLRQLRYHIDCMDLMADQIRVFKKNAKSLRVNSNIQQLSWKQIPEHYVPGTYDFLFCRGNSFIYANGGWNKEQRINPEESLKSYEQTLRIFYNTFRIGGYLYIDKFPDNEKTHRKVVAKIRIGNTEEDLVYYTKRFPKKRIRKAEIRRRTQDRKESGVPNITYDLSEGELERMLKKVGFRNVRKIKLNSEKNFVIWLAQK